MAIVSSAIETVRVMGEDGEYAFYPWQPSSWYSIRDDRPYLDILVRGHSAQSVNKTKLEKLTDDAPSGYSWQRWNFEPDIARDRRFGEISLSLKTPEDTALRCYIIPTALLSYRDVIAMIEDIESELGVNATWEVIDQRPDRSWSRSGNSGGYMAVQELINQVEDELCFAQSIRRDPFAELMPRSRRDMALPENAIVSHWAVKRYEMLQRSSDEIVEEMRLLKERAGRHNPTGRLPQLSSSIDRTAGLSRKVGELKQMLSSTCRDEELATHIYLGPTFQRDYRLRNLLRAFAPRMSEALSTVEAARSHFPPIYLNTLWELWGAVWIAKELRRWGFIGSCFLNPSDKLHSCSWRFERNGVVIEMDYEAHPTLINYNDIPPIHERGMPVLEWAAINQKFDEKRPYLASEEKSSPDYLLRVTTLSGRYLLVGDACLASPQHHAIKRPQDAKLYTVENYRRTVGWVDQDRVIRCDPLGGFVLFPPPSNSWAHLERLPGVGDCTLLCPSPLGDEAVTERLRNFLTAASAGIAD